MSGFAFKICAEIFFFSLVHLCCSEVSISPLFRWPNSVCHYSLPRSIPISVTFCMIIFSIKKHPVSVPLTG
ncbi:hypothetical protein EWJ11_24320 [Salmonella enterica subsp. enterica serovar Abaetetuba]|nr:hypothetical protein [Salmonella enterica subsp. enterica serovar Abaetetuba]